MNHIKSLFITIIACFFLSHICLGEERIVVNLRPYPEIIPYHEPESQNQPQLIAPDPDKMPSQLTELLQQALVSGIFASYGGFLAASDVDGMISFPRRHDKPTIHFLITEKITPVIMIRSIIHHWELETGTPAVLYSVSRQKSVTANLFYWDVQEAQLPNDKHIPIDTIIIFANPKNIFVPIGITETKDRPNLLLPDIYVKNNTTQTPESLYVLNIRYCFGPVNSIYKTTPTSYIELLKP